MRLATQASLKSYSNKVMPLEALDQWGEGGLEKPFEGWETELWEREDSLRLQRLMRQVVMLSWLGPNELESLYQGSKYLLVIRKWRH